MLRNTKSNQMKNVSGIEIEAWLISTNEHAHKNYNPNLNGNIYLYLCC